MSDSNAYFVIQDGMAIFAAEGILELQYSIIQCGAVVVVGLCVFAQSIHSRCIVLSSLS